MSFSLLVNTFLCALVEVKPAKEGGTFFLFLISLLCLSLPVLSLLELCVAGYSSSCVSDEPHNLDIELNRIHLYQHYTTDIMHTQYNFAGKCSWPKYICLVFCVQQCVTGCISSYVTIMMNPTTWKLN